MLTVIMYIYRWIRRKKSQKNWSYKTYQLDLLSLMK
jgi:hypothetical protein